MRDDDGKQAPLNAGSRGLARDPADIYEQTEGRLCVGCVNEQFMAMGGDRVAYCAIGQKRFPKRCRRYDERQPQRR